MIYVEMEKDIKTIDKTKYVSAHCISCDCAMGKGVVLEIIKMYKGVKIACQKYSYSKQRKVLGHAFRYECKDGVVYNLFSKRNVGHKAGIGITVKQYHYQLTQCLYSMKKKMIAHEEKFLAMPQIASGLDRCVWSDVVNIIKNVFNDTDIEILICIYNSN